MRTLLLAVVSLAALVPALAFGDEGFLGLILRPVPADKAKALGFSHPVVQVGGLASGANAQKAGVKEDDIVLKFKGKPVTTTAGLVTACKATKPGTTASLVVSRAGKQMTFKILIVSRETFLGAGIEALKGKNIPELVGNSVFTDQKVQISKLIGKPLIVELWATWCPACVANIPRLDKLTRDRGDKVNVVAVAFEKVDVVKNFFAEHRPSYEVVVLSMNDSSLSYLSNASIPKFIVAAADGTVVSVSTSAEEADAALEQLVH